MSIKKTQSDSATVHEIFQGEVLYRSPLFQRHYVWNSNQLDALWEDIDTVLENSSSSKFLGALVLKPYQNRTATNPQAYWIIDGQQRLTTFYLLLVACVHIAEKLGETDLASDYSRIYLLQQQRNVRDQTKIIPTIPDLGQFKEILTFIDTHRPKPPGGHYGYSDGPLTDAFLRHLDEIEKRIKTKDVPSPDRLAALMFDVCNKIEFVQINLAEHHDANEVFNRLNVSGQPLEIIDLVRNEVFSLLSKDVSEAESIYNNHWIEFEKSFDVGNTKDEIKLSTEIRNGYFFPFALIKNSNTKKSEIFRILANSWKKEIESLDTHLGAKKIIDDLKEFVSAYLALAISSRPGNISDELWEKIMRLYRMPAPTSVYPYTMKLLRTIEKKETKEKEASQCLHVIESFLVRRAFIGLEPTGLHAVFKDLWNKAGSNPAEVKSNIQTKTVEFPDDERFKTGITENDLYHRKLCNYILEEYERGFTKGDVLASFPQITADHIMPQDRTGEWLSIASEEEHEKYLHTWGNLVPLSNKANAEKGGRSWKEVSFHLKDETVFSTTKKVLTSHSEWGIKQILNRSEELAKWAIKRWPK